MDFRHIYVVAKMMNEEKVWSVIKKMKMPDSVS